MQIPSMDKIHACKHPFFFPRNNFITVVKKIHFSLFKLSYKMSVNPQTPNERTNEQTKFSISPISHSLAGRGNEAGEIVFHSEENSRRTSRPRVSYENGLSRVLFVFPRDKSGTVSSSHSLEREKERGREQSTPVQSFKPRTNGRTETEIHDTEPIYHRDNFELLNSPPFPPFQHHRTNWRD